MTKNLLRDAAERHPGLVMPPYDAIAAQGGLDGFEAVWAFAHYLGGSTVYVPCVRTIFAECLLAEARRELGEGRAAPRALARKYGFTERHLRRLL